MKKMLLTVLCLVILLSNAVLSEGQRPDSSRRYLRSGSMADLSVFQMRQAGLRRDQTRADELLRQAQQSKYEDDVLVSLRALSRIGDERALPLMESVKSLFRMRETKMLQILKARLIVEQRANGQKSSSLAEANERLALFFAQLETTPAEFNQDFKKFLRNAGLLPIGGGTADAEWLTLREVADMIYTYKDRFLLQAAEQAELNLTADRMTVLKIRLTFLSPQERLTVLLTELETNTGDYEDKPFIGVLLSDLGTPAQRAIETKLDQMARQRSAFAEGSIGDYLSAYAHFPNNRRLSLVEPFVNDAISTVRWTVAKVMRLKPNEPIYDFRTWRY
jgi:hypothetical protein